MRSGVLYFESVENGGFSLSARRGRALALAAGLAVTLASDAHAYVDPGASSYSFQLLIGGLTAAYFLISNLARRALGAGKRRRKAGR